MEHSPCCIWSQAVCRCLSVNLECDKAMLTAKRCLNRSSSCGVRVISGTSTNTCCPRSSTVRIICRYTSVLPLPVTPSSKKTPNCPRLSQTASIADCCWGLHCKGLLLIIEGRALNSLSPWERPALSCVEGAGVREIECRLTSEMLDNASGLLTPASLQFNL